MKELGNARVCCNHCDEEINSEDFDVCVIRTKNDCSIIYCEDCDSYWLDQLIENKD